ncbi:hypothetical protein Cgig2_009700 [Carnegiea gigantea]|uniref:NAD(P)H-quinone oxidoreductase subunit 5, chloroplastic n=1 Tax=Carnegiea gigantea TaxID=171969 RepID=A0A9Q1JKW9_9CARY|nr:hypothetical protein Cgig2_009700 [Carnegiea gigantea]
MEHIYRYAWIIPFIPLPVPLLIGVGLLFFPHDNKKSSTYMGFTINNDFSLEFGYLIDPLTSIMSVLIAAVAILVLVYSDNYMSHDRGYLRFFACMSFFNISMLGLITNAWQKALVTNRVGDFGLLLGTLVIPYIMNGISFIGIITVLLGAILALAQKDIKRSLAYSAMYQLGYMMYRFLLSCLISFDYSCLFKSITIFGIQIRYSFQGNYCWMFSTLNALSICGIPPLACLWSKDESLNASWLYSPIFAKIAYFTAGLTVFDMFRIYLLTFEGHLNIFFKSYSGKKVVHLINISRG